MSPRSELPKLNGSLLRTSVFSEGNPESRIQELLLAEANLARDSDRGYRIENPLYTPYRIPYGILYRIPCTIPHGIPYRIPYRIPSRRPYRILYTILSICHLYTL